MSSSGMAFVSPLQWQWSVHGGARRVGPAAVQDGTCLATSAVCSRSRRLRVLPPHRAARGLNRRNGHAHVAHSSNDAAAEGAEKKSDAPKNANTEMKKTQKKGKGATNAAPSAAGADAGKKGPVKFALNIKGKPVWDLRRAVMEDVDALMSFLPTPYGSSRSLVSSLVRNSNNVVMVADFSVMTPSKVIRQVLGAGLAVCKGGARSSVDSAIVQRAEVCAFVIDKTLTESSYRSEAIRTLLLGVAARAQTAGAIELAINPHGMVLGIEPDMLLALGFEQQNDSVYVLNLETKKIEPGKKIV